MIAPEHSLLGEPMILRFQQWAIYSTGIAHSPLLAGLFPLLRSVRFKIVNTALNSSRYMESNFHNK